MFLGWGQKAVKNMVGVIPEERQRRKTVFYCDAEK